MSNADYHPLPCVADATKPELETLIQRVVEQTLARLDRVEAAPFINSKLSAELIGISPEHLCAMRARGEGPPWSGDGKWIRYRRSDVLDWIANLPRQANPKTINLLGSKGTRVLIPSQFKKKSPHGSKVALFDRGRAEIYLNQFALYELKGDDEVVEFVGALFAASRGDPEVKSLLLRAPFAWPGLDAEALSAKFAGHWDRFQVAPPTNDGLRTLREMCSRQSWPWPESMITALFDEPSFDAVAYVDCGTCSN